MVPIFDNIECQRLVVHNHAGQWLPEKPNEIMQIASGAKRLAARNQEPDVVDDIRPWSMRWSA